MLADTYLTYTNTPRCALLPNFFFLMGIRLTLCSVAASRGPEAVAVMVLEWIKKGGSP
jgi:hypothetical protein